MSPIHWLFATAIATLQLGAISFQGVDRTPPSISSIGEGDCQSLPLQTVALDGMASLAAVPLHVDSKTPLILMYHGVGPPASPEALARALPPIAGAVTVYPSLPLFGVRAPVGGLDELARRQHEDYIGQLLFPVISEASPEMTRVVAAASQSFGSSKSRPLVIFGFSAGGAVALLSLTDRDLHPRAVSVLNAPLSITQAADSFERQTGTHYVWTASARRASRRFDILRDANKIAHSNPQSAILLLQSELDEGLTTSASESAARGLYFAFASLGIVPDITSVTLAGASHTVLDPSNAGGAAEKRRIETTAMIMQGLRRHTLAGLDASTFSDASRCISR
jgi:predicted esterase